MGGGVGISIFNKYRVATEKTLLAMPECSIGIITDAGSNYIFSRMSNIAVGLYAVLTGYRFSGED